MSKVQDTALLEMNGKWPGESGFVPPHLRNLTHPFILAHSPTLNLALTHTFILALTPPLSVSFASCHARCIGVTDCPSPPECHTGAGTCGEKTLRVIHPLGAIDRSRVCRGVWLHLRRGRGGQVRRGRGGMSEMVAGGEGGVGSGCLGTASTPLTRVR